jgi:hypothetical protein
MDAPAQYLEELRSALGLYPNWLPGDPLELGAFGTLVRGRFVADGRLADLGIEVVPVHHAQPQPVKEHRGMKFRASSKTEAKAGSIDAELGVEVEAAREYAWAFAARGMTKVEIQNIHEVRRLVLEARNVRLTRLPAWRRGERVHARSPWAAARMGVGAAPAESPPAPAPTARGICGGNECQS